jgi:transporter family-2 protein
MKGLGADTRDHGEGFTTEAQRTRREMQFGLSGKEMAGDGLRAVRLFVRPEYKRMGRHRGRPSRDKRIPPPFTSLGERKSPPRLAALQIATRTDYPHCKTGALARPFTVVGLKQRKERARTPILHFDRDGECLGNFYLGFSLYSREVPAISSSFMRLLLIFLMIAAGFCIAIQGSVNSRLRLAVESPVLSSAISFLSGGIVLVCLMATGAFGGTGTGFRGMQTAPPWAFLGGVLGIGYVLGNILAIPRLGVVATVCSAITGQIIGSYLVDTFGWFGVEKLAFSWARLAGIILLFIGVILVTRK